MMKLTKNEKTTISISSAKKYLNIQKPVKNCAATQIRSETCFFHRIPLIYWQDENIFVGA